MFRNKSASVHQFAMVPKAEIPRSSFRMQRTYKTTFGGAGAFGIEDTAADSAFLYPILVEEVLPGDTFNLRMTAFCRLATPLFPIMDNLYLDTFFFFVPNRLVWDNWQKFMGERKPNTDSSIDFLVPTMTVPAGATGGYKIASIYDYMGLPTKGQYTGSQLATTHSALPLRGYNLIYNEWFRDQNIQDEVVVNTDDGPDVEADYFLLIRAKRHDYFTGCLPFPQKGESVSVPLGESAPVVPMVSGGFNLGPSFKLNDGAETSIGQFQTPSASQAVQSTLSNATGATRVWRWDEPGLEVDLSTATAATINQLRQSFQIQKLLERDARGGTRYTEIIRAHFGVVSPDARLQRPEYLGGGSSPISISPVAQTSATAASGTDTPQGNLSAIGTGLMRQHGFTQSFVEHGYIIGLVCVRADLTYQQGLRRHWSRSTRYDFYFPAFAMLGEQAVLSKELYVSGATNDASVFGYQERWAEYRYLPSEITGLFRSTAANTIDAWHLSQRFTSRPTLNDAFIDDAPPISRMTAVGAAAAGQQFLLDAFFDVQAARPLPMYSVPGMIDHF